MSASAIVSVEWITAPEQLSDENVVKAALYLEYKREGLEADMSEEEAEQYAEEMMS